MQGGHLGAPRKRDAGLLAPMLEPKAPLSQARLRPRGYCGTLLGLFQGEWVLRGEQQGWPRSPVDMVPGGGQRFCRALQGLSLWLVGKLHLLCPSPR